MKPQHFTLRELYNNGHQERKALIKMTGYPPRTVDRILKKLREGESLERKVGSGKPALLNSNHRRSLVQLARKNDMLSSSELRKKMIEKGYPAVAPRTIRSYLNRSGYFSLAPKAEPLLKPHHKADRVIWCQQHQKTRWNRWIFSDKSRFQLYRHQEGLWAKKRPSVGVPKFGPSIMVWGAISTRGKSDLVVVRGIINSSKYQEVLNSVEDNFKGLFPSGFVFQQDRATCHTSKSTKAWISDHH